jgi:hypothetical protein
MRVSLPKKNDRSRFTPATTPVLEGPDVPDEAYVARVAQSPAGTLQDFLTLFPCQETYEVSYFTSTSVHIPLLFLRENRMGPL